jgi:hypothetical protein
VASGALLYSYATLVVVFVAVYALPDNLRADLFSTAANHWLRHTRDWLAVPMSDVLRPLGALPGGPLFQISVPLALNAWVFFRSLKILRRRWLQALGWRLLNGYLLALSFVCFAASAAFAGLFLLMALVFGLVAGLEALSH